MRKIAQGRTAEVYEYGPNEVLKLYVSGFSEQAIREEWEASCAAADCEIPVPRALKRVSEQGRHGIVFERADGETLLDQLVRGQVETAPCGRKLASLHWKIHQWPTVGLLRPQQELWRSHIVQARELEEREKKRILHDLDRLPGDNRICHGDFHPANVLLGEQDWILDWMTGSSGHPAGDVARTVILLLYAELPEQTPAPVLRVMKEKRQALTAVYLQHYLELSGLEESDLQRWYLPVMAARLAEWVPDEERLQLLGLIREQLSLLA